MKTVVAVPCFNEGARLLSPPFAALVDGSDIDVLWVDDGSTDHTRAVLDSFLAQYPGRFRLLSLPRNGGKAEAVRAGMNAAMAEGAAIVGYLDADAATPPLEVIRLRQALLEHRVEVVLGSRVKRLGARVVRSELRHYVGRVFATGAALALGLPVYDTQCGAKLFRVGPSLVAALRAPFESRWAFDVELLARLSRGGEKTPGLEPEAFLEVPLETWVDVGGSKVRPWDAVRAARDLLRIGRRRRR